MAAGKHLGIRIRAQACCCGMMWDWQAEVPESHAGMAMHRKCSQGSSFAGVRHRTGWSARMPAQAGVWLLGSWRRGKGDRLIWIGVTGFIWHSRGSPEVPVLEV